MGEESTERAIGLLLAVYTPLWYPLKFRWNMWYDVNKTLSHNCLFNFVVGQRGVGKTYSCKKRVIRNYLRKDEQFVYLRRYKTELEPAEMEKFFDDICYEFPDHDFKYEAGKFWIDSHIAGYALPLSKAAQFKSVPFPRVSMIIFDEFIIDQGMIRYLPNEVVTFNEMYSTIARNRDVTLLALSNAITFTNPYFVFYGLSLQQGQTVVKKGDILLELVENKEYTEMVSQTRFGKIIAGTDYGKYAIQNQFLRDKDTFIEKMPGPGTAIFILRIQELSFCVYNIIGYPFWYISEQIDPTCKRVISLDRNSHDKSSTLKGDLATKLWIDEMKQKYFRAELRFTTIKAQNLITEWMKK